MFLISKIFFSLTVHFLKFSCFCFRVALFYLSKNNSSSFEFLCPYIVFPPTCLFYLFPLIFYIRGLLRIVKNPLLPKGKGQKSQLEALNT